MLFGKCNKGCNFCESGEGRGREWRKCHEEERRFEKTFECRERRTVECREKCHRGGQGAGQGQGGDRPSQGGGRERSEECS